VACSVGAGIGSTRSTAPLALLVALGALLRARRGSAKRRHHRDPSRA
jgi:MYXO-CTERM domain-containing protein